MPVPTVRTKYRCEVCNKIYDKEKDAVVCESGHVIIHVPFLLSDLRRLAAYMSTNDPSYITESLARTIQKYNKLRGQA